MQTKYLPIMPRIGSKFTGKPKGCNNTESGIYWEVLPTIQGDAMRIQRVLTKRKPLTDKLPKLQTKYFGGIIGRMVRAFWKWA